MAGPQTGVVRRCRDQPATARPAPGERRAQPARHPGLLPRAAPGRGAHRADPTASSSSPSPALRCAPFDVERADRCARRRHGQPRPGDRPGRRRRAAVDPPPPPADPRAAGRGVSLAPHRRAPRPSRAVPGGARPSVGDADAVVRAHLRRVAPLVGARRRRAARPGRGGPPRRPRRPRRRCSPTTPSTRCSSTPDGDVWVERDGRLERRRTPAGRRPGRRHRADPRPARPAARPHVTRSSTPGCPTARGSCAVVPPVSADGACLSVRRFRDRSLASRRSAPDAVVAVLELLARRALQRHRQRRRPRRARRRSSTPSLGRCPPGERIVTIEDTVELLPAADHLVRLEARPSTPDGPVADHARRSSCARRCACGPTASSSARSAGRRCWRSSRR